jgi:hypothetical protein
MEASGMVISRAFVSWNPVAIPAWKKKDPPCTKAILPRKEGLPGT